MHPNGEEQNVRSGQGVVFGLGSGRCGTNSLAHLLNHQPGAVCFHELNPSSMAWVGGELTVLSLVRDFIAILAGEERAVTADLVSPNRLAPRARLLELQSISTVGDVASYYLPYVELVLERWPAVRFACLRRDRDEVVASFVRKLQVPGEEASRNHWASPPKGRWKDDRIWDRCFPNYVLDGDAPLEAYVARYYDEYYARVEELVALYPGSVRMFDVTELNDPAGRAAILDYCRPGQAHIDFEVHRNALPEPAAKPRP